ncbi:sigma factor [Streptosporangium saharense]|uniref:RNA polymerase sigma-70 region 2 domain-containing protein n=1 Tax=Streptosporangium saharense TaxID=1706840 RepID=A0A7W7QU66_9ACTN|nr:sigma factor [Streptosporangium saharense]MBB4919817.1 hypothetical protein [Streptosporangium saharense]
MTPHDFLAGRFEGHRPRLKAVAYRMLGSLSEAEDAVQEAWLRLACSDSDEIDNLGGWLTTVVGDMFGLPFGQIATIVDRTPVAAKKLASRARRRVRGAAPNPDPDLSGQRRAVDAFLAALVSVLDPDVVLRADGGVLTGGMKVIRGAEAVAGQFATFQRMATGTVTRPAFVNGLAGLVNTVGDRIVSVMSFTVSDGEIVAIDILSDPARLALLEP